MHQGNFGSAQYTQGGIISSGPLRGIQFVGTKGTPAPFNFGPHPANAGFCYDCSANTFTGAGTFGIPRLTAPYHNTVLFALGSYRLTDNIKATLQLNFGQNFEENTTTARTSTVTVKPDNAYLDPTIAADMTTLGITSFPLGIFNINNTDPRHYTMEALSRNVGVVYNKSTRALERAVFSLDGSIGNDWSWNAYAQDSQVHEVQYNPSDSLTANYNKAVDAVRVTAANKGTSGFAVGNIVCRSSLTDPTNGCVPMDIFGVGVVSDAALDYVDPGLTGKANENIGRFVMQQAVISASAQGTLPWQLPAGQIAVAFGAEYRHEQQTNVADPAGFDAVAGWGAGNYNSVQAQYNVKEAFLEVDAPIIKNGFVQSLDWNSAGRVTDYSTSGTVETWKIGLTSQVNDDIRLRTTLSEDIRAPIISELFYGAAYSRNQQVDPKTGLNVFATTSNSGNPDLKPEEASTISGGVVLTPTWLDGLQISADWYSINIKKAIFTTNTTQIEAQCALGVAIYCADIHYGDPRFSMDYPGALNYIESKPQNASSETTSGLDFQADYIMDLFNGNLDWHMVGNYNDEHTRTALGKTYDGAGVLDGTDAAYTSTPKLRVNLSATYTEGPWSGTVQTRITGAAVLNNAWTNGVDVDNNDVPAVPISTCAAATSGTAIFNSMARSTMSPTCRRRIFLPPGAGPAPTRRSMTASAGPSVSDFA